MYSEILVSEYIFLFIPLLYSPTRLVVAVTRIVPVDGWYFMAKNDLDKLNPFDEYHLRDNVLNYKTHSWM